MTKQDIQEALDAAGEQLSKVARSLKYGTESEETRIRLAMGYLNMAATYDGIGWTEDEDQYQGTEDDEEDGVIYRILLRAGTGGSANSWYPVLEGYCARGDVPRGTRDAQITIQQERLDVPDGHIVRKPVRSKLFESQFYEEDEQDDGSWPGWGGD